MTDTEQTGKLLLQKGGLRKRVTIIPLNKISHTIVDQANMRKAQQLAASKGGQVCCCRSSDLIMIKSNIFIPTLSVLQANLALELVGYDKEIRAAMEHVFGTTIVCDSLDVAKVSKMYAYDMTERQIISLCKTDHRILPFLTIFEQTLTFNKEISRRTVTLEGDCFDPSGTLTGGSKQQIGSVLSKLQVRSLIDTTCRCLKKAPAD